MPSVDDMTTAVATTPSNAVPADAGSIIRQLVVDSRYLILNLPLAVASFAVLIAGFAAGVGTAVTVVGLPILAGALFVSRFFADVERMQIAPVLRQPRVRPIYKEAAPGAASWRRLLIPITDAQSWLDLANGIIRFPLAIFGFVLTVTWWAGALGGLTYWAWDWSIPRGNGDVQLNELLGMGDTTGARVVLYTAFGVFFLLTLPLVIRGAALMQAGLSRTLLTGVAQMRSQITTLEGQRRAAVSAEATALRRLERDIHDGPQQRLVRLAMDLGRAQQQFDADPEAARRTIEEALAQTRETLDELRSLSRGIAPPILVDRGLPSALAALAGRGVIPVDLSIEPALGMPEGRLDPAVESAAYFVVAESLTNVAKHSKATVCRISVGRTGGTLRVEIADDGEGGAHISKGHGLAGLADRVHATGGRLEVASPVGGPTLVVANIPA
jgi:signal transduction histidine kinase